MSITLNDKQRDELVEMYTDNFEQSFIENHGSWKGLIKIINKDIERERRYSYDEFCIFAKGNINEYLRQYNWEKLIKCNDEKKVLTMLGRIERDATIDCMLNAVSVKKK